MMCPYCQSDQIAVVDSRDAEAGEATRRRRICRHCDKRFTTYERVEGLDLRVIKKDGGKEDFNREKLKRGLVKATWKRPVSMAVIEDLINEVEAEIRQRQTNEIKSWEIGNLTITRLKKIDPLSYLLFASVYRDFTNLADFQAEISKLEKEGLDAAQTE